MISAKATIEHANKGQIGQPAACMIDNKANTPVNQLATIMAQPSIHMNCG
jgi:hypothetical protein